MLSKPCVEGPGWCGGLSWGGGGGEGQSTDFRPNFESRSIFLAPICDPIFILYRSGSFRTRMEVGFIYISDISFIHFVSSAVPPGSGAFPMPTRSLLSSSASASSASASTLRGGRANLRNASVFSFLA